jgi:hypothetical protein
MREIDAVGLKNAIQAKLREMRGNKTGEQVRKERQRHLLESNDPVAKYWRRSRRESRQEPSGHVDSS